MMRRSNKLIVLASPAGKICLARKLLVTRPRQHLRGTCTREIYRKRTNSPLSLMKIFGTLLYDDLGVALAASTNLFAQARIVGSDDSCPAHTFCSTCSKSLVGKHAGSHQIPRSQQCPKNTLAQHTHNTTENTSTPTKYKSIFGLPEIRQAR